MRKYTKEAPYYLAILALCAIAGGAIYLRNYSALDWMQIIFLAFNALFFCIILGATYVLDTRREREQRRREKLRDYDDTP